MEISAELVKRLRSETDAPLMECKAALQEANGDFERAKAILREKGKAAAAKRSDRSTSAGLVVVALSDDQKQAGAVVLESETDFVAKNDDFVALAEQLAKAFLASDPGSDPNAVAVDGKTAGAWVEEAIGKIRENIRIGDAVRFSADSPVSVYVHHDNTKAALVGMKGDNPALQEIGRKIAIQCVAFPPDVIRRADLSQEMLDREIETETQRALNEGKPENIARNIAQGRVNKEYVKRVVLLEQDFYADASKTVSTYLAEQAKEGGSAEVVAFRYLAVGKT